MSVTVRFPSPLYRLTGGLSSVEALGDTVIDVLQDLEKRFPGLKDQLPWLHIYVNDEDIRFLAGLQTRLEDQARTSIVAAIAGGKL